MAPEQADPSLGPVGPTADLYALGVILHELLTGLPGGHPESRETRSVADSNGQPRSRRVRSDLPRNIDAICRKCLMQEPARRYSDALGLAEDLRRHAAFYPITARRVGPLERMGLWHRRSPGLARLAMAVVFSLPLIAALGLLLHQRARYQETVAQLEHDQRLKEKLARTTVLQSTGIVKAEINLSKHRYDEVQADLDTIPLSRRGWEWDRMRHVAVNSPRAETLIGVHEVGVASLLSSRDGRMLISSGYDGRLIRWDAETFEARELERGRWDEQAGRWQNAPVFPDERFSPKLDLFSNLVWIEEGNRLAGVSILGAS